VRLLTTGCVFQPNTEEAIIGANIVEGNPFIVMPFYANGSARDYVRTTLHCNILALVRQDKDAECNELNI
jgi:hypothetical protein